MTTAGSVVQAVAPSREGTAAGVLTLAATIGSTIGLAVAGPIFSATSDADLARSTAAAGIPLTRTQAGHAIAVLSGSPSGQSELRDLSAADRARVRVLAKDAFRDGISTTLLPFGVLCLVSVAPALMTQRRRFYFSAPVAVVEASEGS